MSTISIMSLLFKVIYETYSFLQLQRLHAFIAQVYIILSLQFIYLYIYAHFFFLFSTFSHFYM